MRWEVAQYQKMNELVAIFFEFDESDGRNCRFSFHIFLHVGAESSMEIETGAISDERIRMKRHRIFICEYI